MGFFYAIIKGHGVILKFKLPAVYDYFGGFNV